MQLGVFVICCFSLLVKCQSFGGVYEVILGSEPLLPVGDGQFAAEGYPWAEKTNVDYLNGQSWRFPTPVIVRMREPYVNYDVIQITNNDDLDQIRYFAEIGGRAFAAPSYANTFFISPHFCVEICGPEADCSPGTYDENHGCYLSVLSVTDNFVLDVYPAISETDPELPTPRTSSCPGSPWYSEILSTGGDGSEIFKSFYMKKKPSNKANEFFDSEGCDNSVYEIRSSQTSEIRYAIIGSSEYNYRSEMNQGFIIPESVCEELCTLNVGGCDVGIPFWCQLTVSKANRNLNHGDISHMVYQCDEPTTNEFDFETDSSPRICRADTIVNQCPIAGSRVTLTHLLDGSETRPFWTTGGLISRGTDTGATACRDLWTLTSSQGTFWLEVIFVRGGENGAVHEYFLNLDAEQCAVICGSSCEINGLCDIDTKYVGKHPIMPLDGAFDSLITAFPWITGPCDQDVIECPNFDMFLHEEGPGVDECGSLERPCPIAVSGIESLGTCGTVINLSQFSVDWDDEDNTSYARVVHVDTTLTTGIHVDQRAWVASLCPKICNEGNLCYNTCPPGSVDIAEDQDVCACPAKVEDNFTEDPSSTADAAECNEDCEFCYTVGGSAIGNLESTPLKFVMFVKVRVDNEDYEPPEDSSVHLTLSGLLSLSLLM